MLPADDAILCATAAVLGYDDWTLCPPADPVPEIIKTEPETRPSPAIGIMFELDSLLKPHLEPMDLVGIFAI